MMRPPGGGITAAQPPWPPWPTRPRRTEASAPPAGSRGRTSKETRRSSGNETPILRVQLKIPPLLRGEEAITEVLQRFLPRPSFKGRAVPRTSDRPAPPPPRPRPPPSWDAWASPRISTRTGCSSL